MIGHSVGIHQRTELNVFLGKTTILLVSKLKYSEYKKKYKTVWIFLHIGLGKNIGYNSGQ
jgi:hypothetical protein